jgi:putative tricarboxylic transport membrane protein
MTPGSGEPGNANGRRPDRAAFTIALGLAAFGAVLLWDASSIRADGGYSGVGPAAMPKLVGWVLIALGALTAFSGWRSGAADVPSQRFGPVAWLVGGLAAQIVLLQPLGFTLATGLLFACGAAAFGERRFHISIPAGFALAFAVYGLFDVLLRLNLPAGLPERLIYGG